MSEVGYYSQGPVGSYASRIGINRNTWRAGQVIGRAIKRWWTKKRPAAPHAKAPPAKRQKTVQKNTPILQGVVMNEGTGGQYSLFAPSKGRCYLPPHVENALAPQVIQNSQAAQLKSTVGRQNVVAPLPLFLPATATAYTSDKITRVLYQKATADITLNNIYLSNAYVIIYDIVARKDVSLAAVGDPFTAWSQGGTDESVPNSPLYLGSTPWQTEVFNQYWRVAQQTSVVLCAGGTHVHRIRMEPNRVISSAYATYTPYAFKDLSYWTMIEVHGSPANDTTTQTQVSVGVGGLNIVSDYEVTLKQLMKATPTITLNSSLPTSFTVAEQVVNLGGSTITPQAEG